MSIENPQGIEPCYPEALRPDTANRIANLSAAAVRLSSGLHPRTAANLADLVRVMNCYYSNLIEGHNTKPHDIEQALHRRFDADQGKRNLQIEALAHIRLQKKIDDLFAANALENPTSTDFIRWLHREFHNELPESMLTLRHNDKTIIMVPGQFRSLPIHDVSVGRHLPPSSMVVDAFMQYFETRFNLDKMGRLHSLPLITGSITFILSRTETAGSVAS